jgi:lipoate-protein ligase A
MDGMQERYETLAAIVVEALSRLGIRARIGELEGEWCPGAWSVLVGEAKVGGLAQRVIRGAAWSEAVVVVSGAEALRSALDGVERALGIAWRPETLSGLEGVAVDAMREALADALRARWDIKPARVPAELWDRAHALRAEHAL